MSDDDSWIQRVISQGSPRSGDSDGERSRRDYPTLPDLSKELLFRNDAISVRQQIRDQIEHPSLNGHHLTSPPNLEEAMVNFVLAESLHVAHGVQAPG